VHIEQNAGSDPAQDRGTGTNLDVVGMRTQAKHREALTRSEELQGPHVMAAGSRLGLAYPIS
jgi:hypothetical protein